MFRQVNRLLIANRGEIAVRIIRTCRRLGIETVLAASQADADSMAARMADKVIIIGPPPSARSYLDVGAVIKAAQQGNADAIHPGYGFLSENVRLALACINAGIIFIGPTSRHLLAVGDKLMARVNAEKAGLPTVPGGEAENADSAMKLASELGTPLLIKAVGGGGGRGIKLVTDLNALQQEIELAAAEAESAFGDPRLYLEHYIHNGRHVEVQLLGDGSDVIHLGTRDCSVQRRYQKLIEEAPAPNLTPELRGAIEDAAVALGRHLSYLGAGTVEFMVDAEHNCYYFMEMNARLQVEHTVTEEISGLDLVAEQIRLAEGRPLRLRQDEIELSGHAMQCRLNAEDTNNDFQPVPGRVTAVRMPAGVGIRMDSHLQEGTVVPPWYDSMLGKLITHGPDRAAALALMQQALDNFQLTGLPTNAAFHSALCREPEFRAGGVDTGFLTRYLNRRPAAEISS